MRDGEVALPPGIGGIARGEGLGNGKAGLVGIKRAGEIALSAKDIADLDVRDDEIALPSGIGGVARGEG